MEKRLTEQQKTEIELKTIDTLLDQGVQVTLPAPRCLRIFGKRAIRFLVKRPDSETLFRISGLYLHMQRMATTLEPGNINEAHRMIYECMIPSSRIVAYGILPYCTPLGIRNRLLAWFLRRNLDTRQMTELWVMLASLSGAHDFCNYIRSISALRITKPKTT
ncbi:hypothetical protein ACGE0T_00735 [Parabacteroides sp. APC149_11_2_Y6]